MFRVGSMDYSRPFLVGRQGSRMQVPNVIAVLFIYSTFAGIILYTSFYHISKPAVMPLKSTLAPFNMEHVECLFVVETPFINALPAPRRAREGKCKLHNL